MNFIDFFVIIILILGLLIGFKRGFIKSTVMLVGTILVLVLSFYLKNPIATLMYEKLPFFSFKGVFEGVTVLNILIYEAIAFLIVFSVLSLLFKVILVVTKIIDKLLNSLIILTLPSKLLGMVVGFVQALIILFVFLFVCVQLGFFANDIQQSKYGSKIIKETPLLSKPTRNIYLAFEEIYELKEDYKDSKDKSEFNKKAFDNLLKNDVISTTSADKLIATGKLKIDNADSIVEKYRK